MTNQRSEGQADNNYFTGPFFLRECDILNWTIPVPGYVADLS